MLTSMKHTVDHERGCGYNHRDFHQSRYDRHLPSHLRAADSSGQTSHVCDKTIVLGGVYGLFHHLVGMQVGKSVTDYICASIYLDA